MDGNRWRMTENICHRILHDTSSKSRVTIPLHAFLECGPSAPESSSSSPSIRLWFLFRIAIEMIMNQISYAGFKIWQHAFIICSSRHFLSGLQFATHSLIKSNLLHSESRVISRSPFRGGWSHVACRFSFSFCTCTSRCRSRWRSRATTPHDIQSSSYCRRSSTLGI